MNKILKISGVLFFLGLITSCAVKQPLTNDYYHNHKKVGVVYQIDSISTFKQGAQGLLDMALTTGKRFKKPLQVVDEKVNPTNKIKQFYNQLFQQKGKPLVDVSNQFDTESLKKFEKPKSSDKKFSIYDVRSFKDSGIDELLIVKVKYGLMVSYYGVIETGKYGSCFIQSEIIDLSDNSILFKDSSGANQSIKGRWKKPPLYESLELAISKAIQKSVDLEKEKLNK